MLPQDGSPIFLIIYVDDMLLSGRHTGELAKQTVTVLITIGEADRLDEVVELLVPLSRCLFQAL